MLVGLPEVKPDRMIRRFAAAALGRPRETAVGVDEARGLVLAAAARLGVSPARSTTPSGAIKAVRSAAGIGTRGGALRGQRSLR